MTIGEGDAMIRPGRIGPIEKQGNSSGPELPREPSRQSQIAENDAGSALLAILSRLDRIEMAISTLIEQKTVKEWYSTDEVATILAKAPFTVREWCRLGRIHADKRACGRGNTQEWMISHDELTRLRNEGLLPTAKYNHYR